MPPDIFNTSHRAAIVDATIRHRQPAIFPYRYYVAGGGLMSYGVHLPDLYRGAASYVDRILKGEKPAEIPCAAADQVRARHQPQDGERPRTPIPPTLLARADEVIE